MAPTSLAMRLGQLGFGPWGRNLLRVFRRLHGVDVAVVCDPDPRVAELVPAGIEVCRDAVGLFALDLDAVVIATPPALHFAQARYALERGLHVFVEKPLALSFEHAETLVRLAAERSLVLMVGHVVLYDDAVGWVKDYIEGGEMGDIHYANFQRTNLGRVRQDVDALWNLAPHDISIVNYWFGEEPSEVHSSGVSFSQKGIDDMAFLELGFPSGRFANIHVSWLGPHKTRRAVLVGSKKMVVYDDTSADARIAVHDKVIDRKSLDRQLGDFESLGQLELVQRTGEVWIPNVRSRDPMELEARHFVDCIRTGTVPLTDGKNGLSVVAVLEAASRSRPRAGHEPTS